MPLEALYERYEKDILNFSKHSGMLVFPFSDREPFYVRFQRNEGNGIDRIMYLSADRDRLAVSGYVIGTEKVPKTEMVPNGEIRYTSHHVTCTVPTDVITSDVITGVLNNVYRGLMEITSDELKEKAA